MSLDLSALDGNDDNKSANVKGKSQEVVADGKPLDLPLSKIEEDPDQPRKEYSEKSLEEMASSIKERNVKQPISVRPHPEISGHWIINFGSRRYRGSKLAKKKTIPAFVDEKSDDYDQVIENDQRENLTSMEMAIFIQKKLDQDVKRGEIAKKLGRPNSVISEYLSLIDPPDCVLDAYRSGKCTSPRTLYELRQLHKKFPEQVDLWYKTQEEVTRKSVGHLSDELKGKKDDKGGKFRHDENSPGKDGNGSGGSKTSENDPASKDLASSSKATSEKKTDSSKGSGEDKNTLINPVLAVEFSGRKASILLNKKPRELGMIGILFDEGGEAEVEAHKCVILHLAES